MITCLLLYLTFNISKSVDCVYDPKKPATNCLLYCSEKYSGIPQRRYYNQTSQNCQRMNGCPPILGTLYYYDYGKNLCFDSFAQKNIIPSPPDLDNAVNISINTNPLICLHGTIGIETATGINVCYCHLFWKDSGKSNNLGVPYKCDIVQTNLSKIFKNITTLNGVITRYDKYSASQAETMLKNELAIQSKQSLSIASNNEVTIQFEVSALPEDPYIGVDSLYLVYLGLLGTGIIIALTIYENRSQKIKVTKEMFEKRLNSIIRDLK